MILPSNNPTLKKQLAEKSEVGHDPKKGLPFNVEYGLSQLLTKEIHLQQELTTIKGKIREIFHDGALELFGLICSPSAKFISEENLLAFLKKTDPNPSKLLIPFILRRLDNDKDEKVSYTDFLESFQSSEISSPSKESGAEKNIPPPAAEEGKKWKRCNGSNNIV